MIEGRWLVALLCVSCASGPTRYAQTTDTATSGCLRNPTCYTQPGDEAFLPWVDKAARAAATAGAAMKVLEAADVARIEHLLVECAKEANFVSSASMTSSSPAPVGRKKTHWRRFSDS